MAESSWLLKIADNVCKSRRRATRRRYALEMVEDPQNLQQVAAPANGNLEILMPLQEALERLTEAQRNALLLREWRGLSYDEIAEEFGVGRGAVEALLFRARRTLAEELESPGRKRRRRVPGLELGWLFSGGKSLFGGGGLAVKATATAVLVTATASMFAISVPREEARPAKLSGSVPARPSTDVRDLRSLPRAAPAQTASPEAETSPAGTVSSVGTAERSDAPLATPVTSGTPPSAPPSPGSEGASPSAPTATQDPVAAAAETVTADPVVEGIVSTAGPVLEPVEEAAAPVVETLTESVNEVVETTTTATGDELSSLPTLP